MDKEKYIGESKIQGKPKNPLAFKLMDKCVKEKHLSDEIQYKLNRADDLQHQIESLIQGSSVPITNQFGDSEWLVISQKTLTDAFNRVWGKLEEITGESLKGFTLVVTPEYYIGEEGCTVNISANSAGTIGKFEYIKFYINGGLVTEATDVDELNYSTTITDTSVVKCVAKILGIEYMEQKTITHFSSFFLGAGTAYTQIMNVSHIVELDSSMKANKNITCNDSDRIFIVIGKSLRDGFSRADMNGVEIPFTESEATVDGKQYVVFTSRNTYQRGSYNIDINS